MNPTKPILVERLERLVTGGRALMLEPNFDRLLQRIADLAREVVQARFAAIGLLARDRRSLEYFVTSGLDPQGVKRIGEPPRGHGILGLVIREARPIRLPDLTRHPESTGFPPHHPVMHSFLGVPVLRGVSFHAAPGTTTALVGSSGSGKSTLISLIMAFNRPSKGRIRIDDEDLAGLRLLDYRQQLASVLQENFLFDGTIAENIGYARPGSTLDEIKYAAKVAHCEEFILKFPEGYDTIVGERGIKLSGGQRQRVSIARAILASPKVLILDEATSSLDSESEEMIQDGLKQLRTGRTTFVIAHRLSTIRSADQILVMEGGEIVERGTHAELLARDGRYRQLYDKQYKLETNRFINPGEDWTPEEPKPVAAMRPPSNQL